MIADKSKFKCWWVVAESDRDDEELVRSKAKNADLLVQTPISRVVWFGRSSYNYRLPEFAKFTSQDGTSTIEHVSRYLTQLGEASVEDAHQIRFFSLSLSGPAFTWFSSLPVNSIANWADLEKKFHTYFYTRTREKKMTDLATMRQRTNESGTEFLQRFRETRNLCFSLSLADDQLAALAI